MHCLCCNRVLNDFELTRRHAVTMDFLDMCTRCHSTVSEDVFIPTVDRKDLMYSMGIIEGFDDGEESAL